MRRKRRSSAAYAEEELWDDLEAELPEEEAPPAVDPPSLAAFVEQTADITIESWQHIVCGRLQRLMGEQGQRILMHGPPQFGKSIIISQRFPAYGLGIDPLHRFRLACYNVSHAERFSAVNLALMQMPEYAAMFPDARCRVPGRPSVAEWSTVGRAGKMDANASFMPLGLATGFTGVGVDTLIVDDPYKNRVEARSEATNAALWGWWTDVVLPRLNPATNIVVMFHRWWEGDFAGKLIEQGGWELLRFPAIADGKPGDPTGRKVGEPLSSRYSIAYLRDIERKQGTSFNALYQGDPLPASGGMFKSGKVRWLDEAPKAGHRARWWDKAATEGDGDWTVGVLMSIQSDGLIVIEDVVRGQWEPSKRDARIKETAELDRSSRGFVRQIGTQDPGQAGVTDALAFTKLLVGHAVHIERESGDKVVRADPLASQWNAGGDGRPGNVAIVRGPWNEDYLNEMHAFPNGKNDDQVDGSSGVFSVLSRMGGGSLVG